MIDQRQLTAFHEAAHAVVAVSLGMKVREVSIRPRSGNGIVPDSWGHVSHWRLSDPRPEDCWSGSAWFETWAMTTLAGYVIEELLDPEWYFWCEALDHRRAIDMLREFSPREPDKGVRLLARLREQTSSLLIRPEILAEVTRAADLLLAEEQATGAKFYESLYDGKCRARHPSRTEIRCQKSPHPFGGHISFGSHIWQTEPSSEASPIIWDGLPAPPRNQKVGSMTLSQKRIRAINLGHAPRRLPKSWSEALDEYSWNRVGD
jgi:hypothetical protein